MLIMFTVVFWSQIGMFILGKTYKASKNRIRIHYENQSLKYVRIRLPGMQISTIGFRNGFGYENQSLNYVRIHLPGMQISTIESGAKNLFLHQRRMSTYFPQDEPLYGVHHDVVQHQNLDRLQEINDRTLSRFVPEAPLPPNFAFRPAMTKYTLFPMLDNRMPAQVPIEANYGPSNMFSPPLMQCGPVAGYQRSVDVEADLRGQLYANNKNCNDATVYVPESKSDMYRVSHVEGQGTGPNPLHSMLFQQFVWESAIHPNLVDSKVGNALLFNSTRTQLRGEEDAE